ncbi:MAG: SIS domain-containing protein [Vicinamibacterales bacterium]
MKADENARADARGSIEAAFFEASRLHAEAARDMAPAIEEAASLIGRSIASGGKVLAFGNGGSAADSQHLAAELVGRFTRERRALPAIALTTDSSIVTSVANDYGFDRVFARQVEALGRRGDVAVAISTSGRSENVIAALREAGARGLRTIALTGGDGGPAGKAAEVHLNVPASTPRAQEVHRTILHVLCDLVEREVAGAG